MKQNNTNRLAIIPARGGSKRIPGKNLRLFNGKPIISYSIAAAQESGLFTQVMVSTDDEKIAKVARKYGAQIPFMRSLKNADDYATTTDVLLEVLNSYEERGTSFEMICCIYPTAVFVNAEKLKKSLSIIDSRGVDSSLPIVAFSYPVQRGLRLDMDGQVSYVAKENRYKRSQDLEKIYHDAGQFYWLKTKAFRDEKDLILTKNYPYIVSELEVQDIDNEVDWSLAELKYSMIHKLNDTQ